MHNINLLSFHQPLILINNTTLINLSHLSNPFNLSSLFKLLGKSNIRSNLDDHDESLTKDGKRDIFSLRRSRIPSPVLIHHEPPLRRPASGPNGVSLRSGQIPRVTRKKDPKPNPREWYGSPPSPPQSWGPKDKNGRHLFKYTECGELERGKMYTEREIRRYLFGPKRDDTFPPPTRLTGVPEVQDKIRHGLTLWIGWVAPQSNDRYPLATQSQKCRFADCEDSQNTIRTGFPRIILDERMNDDGEVIDPYHNAGYMHLYCFEKHFDLIDALIHLDVRPDERNFKHEDNLFKLTRQYSEMRTVVDLWWHDEYPKFVEARSRGKRRDHSSYKTSLSARLVAYALENSSDARLKLREERGGANMSKHKGDLAKQKFLRQCRNFGLLDENDDPIPGAHEQLPELMSKKRQAKKLARTAGRRDVSPPLESPFTPVSMEFPSAPEAPQQSTPDINPDDDQKTALPSRQPSPVEHCFPIHQGPPYSYEPPTTANHNQSTPPSPTNQQPSSSPIESTAHKRDRDEVLIEDQNLGIPCEPDQGNPKKLRISPPLSPAMPETVYTQTPRYTDQQDGTDSIPGGGLPEGTEAGYLPTPSPSPFSHESVGVNMGFDVNVDSTTSVDASFTKSVEHTYNEDREEAQVTSVEFLINRESNEGDDLFGGPADAAGLADPVTL
ncbi:uncharacterized protein F4812DRAFT_451570 [Daldinia caldariorum]|uniref:uncharacterized protein n=1 Tax=Daldinia caldariorum TaxID=326644 RepID=UPI002007FE23|nr:uncharacterized protein F4812DRAFT_451570 [Daldinia caldariorum]KAI1467305.1 hypothetical protein F4812DRAFT_451570 [Daldinia caldariorum]